ncbi:hypothetical protein IJ101_02500 [Candidatus Saccharibacteria bacterium]|nr:hypothetical protein [Candidatus Saccharibacteria bacterium]
MKKMLRNAILLIMVLVGFVFIPSNNAEALSAEEKIYGYGVYLCYTDNPNGYYPVLGEITLEQFKTWSDIIHLGSVPAKSTESRLKATTTCKGAFEKAGKTASTSSVQNKNKALENYGYVGKTVGECMSFSFQKTPLQNGKMSGSTETIRIQGLCSSNPGNVSGDNSWLDKNSNAKWPVGFTFQNNVFRMGLYDPSQKGLVYPNKLYPLSGSLSSLMDSINSDIKSHFSRNTNDGNTSDGNNFIYSDKHAYLPIGAEMVPAADNSTKSKFELENRTQAALNLLGIGSVSDLMFTKEEKYALYNEYLNSIYGINASNVVCDKEASPGDNYVLGAFKIGGMYKACWANAYKNNGNTVNALGGNYFNGTQKTWQDLVRELYEDFKDQIGEVVPEETQEDAEAEEDGDVDCQSSGAAKSLGWIVCPILQWLSDASEDMYNDLIKEHLDVSPQLFKDEGSGTFAESGTFKAWQTFQGFANVVFVIFLLVIIFSQVTGVGIDNYGIKKMLPKIILAAVLVNLSYYICIIFVDISNIVGNGVQSLFDGLLTTETASVEGVDIGIGSGTMVSVAVLAALAAGGAALILNPAILLTLFISAISIIVSIAFLFVMLSVREAAIVVLVALSPIAFVLYVLPNSKSYFDKYVRLFSGLLLLYPICGLMVGGGNFVSRLLLSSGFAGGGLAAAFTAMVIGVAPILFIPMLLKNSLNALGGLGGTLSGIGKTVGGRAQKLANDSKLNASLQESGIQRRTRILGGLDKNGNPVTGWRRRFATTLAGGNRNRQRSALQYQKMIREQGSLKAADEQDFMLKTATDNEMTRIVASGEINDGAKMQRELEKALVSGDRAKIRAYTDGLALQGEDGRSAIKRAYDNSVGRMSMNSARTFASNIMANHAAEFKNNNRSMFDVANSINNGGQPQTVSAYAGQNSDKLKLSTKAETLSGMDDEAFAETFMGGKGNYKNGAVSLGGLSPDDKRAIGQNAYNALQNSQNMKADRVARLNEILRQSGYVPEPGEVRVVP